MGEVGQAVVDVEAPLLALDDLGRGEDAEVLGGGTEGEADALGEGIHGGFTARPQDAKERKPALVRHRFEDLIESGHCSTTSLSEGLGIWQGPLQPRNHSYE